jgi:hypothetical protein
MRSISSVILLTFAAVNHLCYGCNKIVLESDVFAHTEFTKTPMQVAGTYGRSSYISNPIEGDKIQYMYFAVENLPDGSGRWVVNDELGVSDSAVAFVGEDLFQDFLNFIIIIDTF